MDQEQQTILNLAIQSLRFASNHPYAATGIFGAAVGSAITYRIMTLQSSAKDGVFTPKVYEFAASRADLQRMLDDPKAELRWDLPTMSVVMVNEKRERPKELSDIPDIEGEEVQ